MHNHDASRQAFDEIFRLVRSGQLQMAERKCNSMLTEHPGDANIVGLHGVILLKLGREDDAQQALQKAIALEPGFAKPHEDLGRLFLARKEFEQASHHFKQAIQLDGSQATAYSGLANALAQLGKPLEAKAAHREFLQRSPVAGTLIEADKLLRDGDGAGAERLCNQLLQRDPDNIQVLRMLARIASDGDSAAVAENLLRRIINLSPNEYSSHIDLGRFLVEQERFPEAVEIFEHAVRVNDKIAENFLLLGDAQAVTGKSSDALASYQLALHLQPGDPHALTGQAHMQRIAGNGAEAIASYEKCTAAQPEFGNAWWSLASFRGYSLSDEQVQTIHSQIAADDLSVDSEIAMRFALARASEARENYDEAWKDYSLGNSLKREHISYDPVQTEVEHDAIIEQFTNDLLNRGISETTSQHAPIFILGMPRAGSTLIEQILASHSMVEGTGELPYIAMLSSTLGQQRADGLCYPAVMPELTGAQLESLGKAYLYYSKAHRGQGRPCFTDKMPANFSHIGFISMILPNAKIIDVHRHPIGTCVANYRQLYARGKNQAYDLVDFAEYYLEYTRIMDHWQEVLPGRVLRVHYEDVVSDLEGQARRMIDYCELPWEDACLDFHRNTRAVNTASAEQVREPIYTEAVDFWKNYEPYLEPVREILEPVLRGK